MRSIEKYKLFFGFLGNFRTSVVPERPKPLNLFNKILWLPESKALRRSQNMAIVCNLFSKYIFHGVQNVDWDTYSFHWIPVGKVCQDSRINHPYCMWYYFIFITFGGTEIFIFVDVWKARVHKPDKFWKSVWKLKNTHNLVASLECLYENKRSNPPDFVVQFSDIHSRSS